MSQVDPADIDTNLDRSPRYAKIGAIFTFITILIALFAGNYLREHHSYLITLIVPAATVLALGLGIAVLRSAFSLSPRERKKQITAFVSVLFLAVLVSELSIVAPIERIHFLKYGSLAFFLFFSHPKPQIRLKSVALRSWALASSVGILEECAQYILPGRVFDLRDISLNIAGAIIGTLLAVVTACPAEEN